MPLFTPALCKYSNSDCIMLNKHYYILFIYLLLYVKGRSKEKRFFSKNWESFPKEAFFKTFPK